MQEGGFVVLKKIKNLIKRKNVVSLRSKFQEIEERVISHKNDDNKSEEETLSVFKHSSAFDGENNFFEEEVRWWEDDEKDNELDGEGLILADCRSAIDKLKKSELYLFLHDNTSLALESINNKESQYMLATWECDYKNLSKRRKTLEAIKSYRNEMIAYGSRVELVHSHKRLGISSRIGVKVILQNNQDGLADKPNSERGENTL